MPNDGLLRIFWPTDLLRSTAPGVIIGWRNSDYDVFVLTVLDHVEMQDVEEALKTGLLFRNSPFPISRIFSLCGNLSLHVLGSTNSGQSPTASLFSPLHLQVKLQSPRSLPQLLCPKDTKLSVQFILFERPRPTKMQYMSLTPLSLALLDKNSKSQQSFEDIDPEDAKARKDIAKLVEKLEFHTVIKRVPSSKEQSLPAIINQINCAYEVDSLLMQNVTLMRTRPKRALSVSQRVADSASSIWGLILSCLHYFFFAWVYPILTQGLTALILGHRVAAEVVLRITEWRPRPEAAALKDLSATAQQIDIRLQQFCYWPIQYLTLRKRKNDWKSVTNSHPDYIRFYNSLWLVANDVIIGIALGSYIMDNAAWVAHQINLMLSVYTVEGLQRTISWLMGWPAGLKLNNELAVFLGDLFLWVIERWAGGLESLRPYLKDIIYVIGCCSFAGASMTISMFSDLLSILTMHIYCFYIASARIYNWQLTIIISLFHLFRGRKRNVLRNRIDYCDYDLDQLLLGTILFTVLFFLLSTVVVFYVAFASARMIIIFFKAALDTCLAFLNHFPLFAVMLRAKDAKRLPGGVHFELLNYSPEFPTDNHEQAPTSYICLKSIPLSLTEMFYQYFQLGHRLRKHYLSPSVILCLVTGHFIPPIDRRNMYSLQYMMLPAQRVGVGEVWALLNERKRQGRATAAATTAAKRTTMASSRPSSTVRRRCG